MELSLFTIHSPPPPFLFSPQLRNEMLLKLELKHLLISMQMPRNRYLWVQNSSAQSPLPLLGAVGLPVQIVNCSRCYQVKFWGLERTTGFIGKQLSCLVHQSILILEDHAAQTTIARQKFWPVVLFWLVAQSARCLGWILFIHLALLQCIVTVVPLVTVVIAETSRVMI